MRLTPPLFAVLALLASLSTVPATALAGDVLSAQEIRKLAPGRYAVNVMGLVNMVVSMRPNGVITGKANGQTDTGFWYVQGQKLCVAWNKWNDGKRRCAVLSGDGGQYAGGGMSIRRI
jgi:hypothetical protein